MKTAVTVVVALLLAGGAYGQNLLTNGGFETGDFTGWNSGNANATVETDTPPEGQYFVRWPGQIDDEQINQRVDLEAGVTYTLEWDWAILEAAVNSEGWRFATVGIGQTDGFWWGHWSVAVSQSAAPDEFQLMDWTHGSLEFTPTASGSYPVVFANFQTDAVWALDNFSLTGPGQDLFPGDADESGTVDLADLAILATNWNTIGGATWGMGDFNDDGNVDLADLAILATNWNQSAPVALAAAELGLPAIPEPATLSLLGLGALALIRRRR